MIKNFFDYTKFYPSREDQEKGPLTTLSEENESKADSFINRDDSASISSSNKGDGELLSLPIDSFLSGNISPSQLKGKS
jgi:hypothetical protein